MLARGSCLVLRLLLLLYSTGAPGAAEAQGVSPSSRDRYWLSGGPGLGRSGSGRFGNTLLAIGANITYQPGPVLFSVRVAGLWNALEGDALGDVGLLAGLGTRGRRSHASLSVGPALTGGSLKQFGGDSSSFSRLGLALQVQLLGLPGESIGLGVTGFANLNKSQSFGGLIFSLAVGQLR